MIFFWLVILNTFSFNCLLFCWWCHTLTSCGIGIALDRGEAGTEDVKAVVGMVMWVLIDIILFLSLPLWAIMSTPLFCFDTDWHWLMMIVWRERVRKFVVVMGSDHHNDKNYHHLPACGLTFFTCSIWEDNYHPPDMPTAFLFCCLRVVMRR